MDGIVVNTVALAHAHAPHAEAAAKAKRLFLNGRFILVSQTFSDAFDVTRGLNKCASCGAVQSRSS
jgi:hypothetical protein